MLMEHLPPDSHSYALSLEGEMNWRDDTATSVRYLLPFRSVDWAVDDDPAPSQQVELVGQAFLALHLIELLSKYGGESFFAALETDQGLIERGISLVEEVQRGKDYLRQGGFRLAPPPAAAEIAADVETRTGLSIPEACRSVLDLLRRMQEMQSHDWDLEADQVALAQQLFEEIHTGILGQLEELRTQTY